MSTIAVPRISAAEQEDALLQEEIVAQYSGGQPDRNQYIYMLTVEDVAQVYLRYVSGDWEVKYDEASPFWDLPVKRQTALVNAAMRAVEHYFGEHWVETIETGFDLAEVEA